MSPSPGGVYLRSYLAPFAHLLDQADVTDILVNRPGELWVERLGQGMERLDAPLLTGQTLSRLAQQIASLSHQGVSREHPLLSASLPDGSRVQVVLPPATRGEIAMAIRRHVVSDRTLDDYEAEGAFSDVALRPVDEDAPLRRLLDDGEITAFLRQAVLARKTIVLSGGTSSGKTTLLNALLKEIPVSERLVTIEDAAEVKLEHPNALGLIAARGVTGEAQVTAEDLLQACLRLRPDRILLGELRGREAFSFLRAVNTGHPGSITTVHADSPRGALDQIALMTLQAGLNIGWSDVRAYVAQVVDVIVQLGRRDGRRRVTEVLLNPR
ncbi:P-type DNA transfer ATPase VirB11 [Caulobacter sp. NIBR2454]|uniref:P-type DNA transfer ATPase VirB11 n=1 Tax=Caulobacter sp. NIBR2454 TaxID=3015996 RepID=UPI0022B69838|nr:P-type DNA transfer ATPase VirB11 [Caulobacter sp. NIBR2454]